MPIEASSKGIITQSYDLFPACSFSNALSIFEIDRENEASLAVLPDLLEELDSMTEVCDL